MRHLHQVETLSPFSLLFEERHLHVPAAPRAPSPFPALWGAHSGLSRGWEDRVLVVTKI